MYLDTSVLVKLYTREPDSAECERIVTGHRIVSSELLYTELWSALLAKERHGVLSPDHRQQAWQLFEVHLLDEVVELVDLDGTVVREAAEVIARVHPRVARCHPSGKLHRTGCRTFVYGDRRMIDAAKQLGLPLAG
jgi:predicted nucleic acid-binding protein